MAEKRIVIVGYVDHSLLVRARSSSRAGVAGLTSALLLSENPTYRITVAAKHMPGDFDIEYASPWAGANYMPSAGPSTGIRRAIAEAWIGCRSGARPLRCGTGTPGLRSSTSLAITPKQASIFSVSLLVLEGASFSNQKKLVEY